MSASDRICRVAMCQMLVEGGQPEPNLERAAQMIRQAAAQQCRIAVLPECLDLGWTFPEARDLAEPLPGRYSDRLCAAARQSKIYVVAGLTERAGARLHNAAILITPEGEVLLKHRKINLLPGVETIYSTGDRLSVAEIPEGRIGVNICADNFPDSLVLGQSLARMGADMLLSPCAWAVDADHDNRRAPYGDLWRGSYGELSRLYDLPVIGVSNVGWIRAGPWQGRKCIGCSLAMGGGGEILTEGPYGDRAESVIAVDVRLRRRA